VHADQIVDVGDVKRRRLRVGSLGLLIVSPSWLW